MDRGDWNHCKVSGRLLADPVRSVAEQSPMAQVTFWLECRELPAPGEVIVTQIPCVASGRVATEVGAFQAGDPVTVTGQLAQRPEGGLMVRVRTIGG